MRHDQTRLVSLPTNAIMVPNTFIPATGASTLWSDTMGDPFRSTVCTLELPLSTTSAALLALAHNHAVDSDRGYIGPEHVALALTQRSRRLVAACLEPSGCDVTTLQRLLSAFNNTAPLPSRSRHVTFVTPRLRKLLAEASTHASQLGNRAIEPPHMLLALLDENEGLLTHALHALGLDSAPARKRALLAARRMN